MRKTLECGDPNGGVAMDVRQVIVDHMNWATAAREAKEWGVCDLNLRIIEQVFPELHLESDLQRIKGEMK